MLLGKILALLTRPQTPSPAEPPRQPAPSARRTRLDAQSAWWAQAQRDTFAMSPAQQEAAGASPLGRAAMRELEREGLPINEVTLLEQLRKMDHQRQVRASIAASSR